MSVFCVNTKSKEFIEMSLRLNIHPSNLEVCVHLFLNSQYAKEFLEDNGELPFPSEDYVKEFFFKGNTSTGRLAIREWVINFGGTLGIALYNELSKAISIAGRAGVHMYKDIKGNPVIRVSRPLILNASELRYLLELMGFIKDNKLSEIASEKTIESFLDNIDIPKVVNIDNNGNITIDKINEYQEEKVITDSELMFLKPIEDELKKLKTLKKSLVDVPNVKEYLHSANLAPYITGTIMRAISRDTSLKILDPLTIFNLVKKLRDLDIVDQYNKYRELPINKALEEHLLNYLKKYHIESVEDGIAERYGVTGVYDIFNKIIHLANNRNAITVSEEFAHAFVELMGSTTSTRPENADYTFLFNNIRSTAIFDLVFEEYKNTYKKKDGTIDIDKIKKEAIGLALAVAINNKWKEVYGENEKSFWERLKNWFNKILDLFKNEKPTDIQKLFDLIATEIIQNDYSRLAKIDTSKYSLLEYDETIAEQNKRDGGKALKFMQWFTSIGNIITGSISYRKQGTVYRGKLDALHDIDMKVPPSAHHIDLNGKELKEVIKNNKWGSTALLDYLKNTDYFKKVLGKYPLLTLVAAYSSYGDNGISINSIYSENQELVDRFISLSGSYASRLDLFTEEERSLIYLFDFFISDKELTVIYDEKNNIALAHFSDSFGPKLEMGRAKDITDYLMYLLFDEYRDNSLSDEEYLMFQRLPYEKYNPEQLEAIRLTVDYITDEKAKEDFFLISGKAGTGKTTIVDEIIGQIKDKTGNLPTTVLTAVANKAVGVIHSKVEALHSYMSTAKALGFIEYDNEDGEMTWIRPKNYKISEIPIANALILIVDEASMLNDSTLAMMLEVKKALPYLKLILIGDEGLISPILDLSDKESSQSLLRDEKTTISCVFTHKNKKMAELLVRVRQGEDSPVLDFADKYWNYNVGITTVPPSMRFAKSHISKEGALVMYSDNDGELPSNILENVLPLFKEGFETQNTNIVKIVCGHVIMVTRYNNAIYKLLHPEETDARMPLHVGDLIMYYAPYTVGEDLDKVKINNSDEFIIKDVIGEPESVDVKSWETRLEALCSSKKPIHLPSILTLKVVITVNTDTGPLDVTVDVVCPELNNINNFRAIQKEVRRLKRLYPKEWRGFKDLLDDITSECGDVLLGYAISAHKSQGSTYQTVVVDAKDILGGRIYNKEDEEHKSSHKAGKPMKGWTDIEKSRMIYTALTRASNETIVLAGNCKNASSMQDVKGINDSIKKNKGQKIYTSSSTTVNTKPVKTATPLQDKVASHEESTKSWESIQEMWDNIFTEHNDKATLIDTDDAHYYIYYPNGKDNPENSRNTDNTVTELVNPIKNRNAWLNISGKIGTTADRIVRDYFLGVDILSIKYPNMSEKDIRVLKNNLDLFKDFLDKELLIGKRYKVRTDLLPLLFKTTIGGQEKLIGGSPDIIVYTEDGDYYIFDVKTTRNDLSLKAHLSYDSQVNTYQDAIETAHPELKDKCKGRYLFNLHTMYSTPEGLSYRGILGNTSYTWKKDDLLIFANGKPILDSEGYTAPTLNDNNIKSSIIKITRQEPKAYYYIGVEKKSLPLKVESLNTLSKKAPEEDTFSKELKSRLLLAEGKIKETPSARISIPLDDNSTAKLQSSENTARTAKQNKDSATKGPDGKALSGTMNLLYEDNSRNDITSESTIKAIANGERTATTRFGLLGDGSAIEYWSLLKVGDKVEFHDKDGRSILVEITKELTPLNADIDKEEWSKKEGWSVEYFNEKVLPKIDLAWLMEYKYIPDTFVDINSKLLELLEIIENELPVLMFSSDKVSISTEGYEKDDPVNNSDTAYIFTENALANAENLGLPAVGPIPTKGITLNVKDYKNTSKPNLAGIRINSLGKRNKNAFGIIVKKYQLDKNGKWVSKEGLFEDNSKDEALFKRLNLEMFKRLEEAGLDKVVLPSQMAMGKSALPKNFARWLAALIYYRFGVKTKVRKNNTSGYEGYGIVIEKDETVSLNSNTINIYAGNKENSDLSNLAIRPFTISIFGRHNVTFNSVEQAFLWAKGFYVVPRYDADAYPLDTAEADIIQSRILKESPSKAKLSGREYKMTPKLLLEWNKVSRDLMKLFITESFKLNPLALKRLLSTGNAIFTHKNANSKDLDVINGESRFPKVLMEVREELGKTNNNTPTTIISTATLHSGGAEFSDTKWDVIGKEYGLISAKHYREPNATSVDSQELKKLGVKPVNISLEDYDEGIEKATLAARDMYDFQYTIKSDYLIRNWALVKYSDAIYAIGTIRHKGDKVSDKKDETRIAKGDIVKGGTGYAVQMAINEGKPVHVYDGTQDSWFIYDYELEKFVKENTPTLTLNFAGIGTRSLSTAEVANKSLKAIHDVYEKTIKEGFVTAENSTTSEFFNVQNINKSRVTINEYNRPWKSDPTKSNRALLIRLKSDKDGKKGYFLLVKDNEDGYYSVHFKTSREGGMFNSSEATEYTTKEERKILFEELVKAIPYGAKVSTWGEISTDGIKGLNNVGKDMIKIGTRTIHRKGDGSEVLIPIFLNISKQELRKLLEELEYRELMTSIAIPKESFKELSLTKEELKLIEERKALNESAIVTPALLLSLARSSMYLLSDMITLLNSDKSYNEEFLLYLPENVALLLLDIDFSQMTRIELILEIGLDNLFTIIRNKYFNKMFMDENRRDNLNRKLSKKMLLIYQNFNAFREMALNTLALLENIGINDRDIRIVHDESEDAVDGETASEMAEIKGSAIETWQIGFRLISAYNSLSLILKRFLNSIKDIDSLGNPKLDEYGIPARVDSGLAVGNILRWTLGAENLTEMISMLEPHVSEHPWVLELLDKLNSNDETFKSLFYSNFKKYFLPYIIQFEKKTFAPDGTVIGVLMMNKVINENSLESVYIGELLVKWLDRKNGTLPLLYKNNGKINITGVNLIETAVKKLELFLNSTATEITDEVKQTIKDAFEVLDITIEDNTLDKLTKKDIKRLGSSFPFIAKSARAAYERGDENFDLVDHNRKNLNILFSIVADYSLLNMESVSYEDGKLHYSYVTPSFLSKLVQRLQGKVDENFTFVDSDGEVLTGFDAWMEKEYGQYPWFKDPITKEWQNEWLRLLATDEKARENFKHAVVLTSLTGDKKLGYRDKSPVLYEKSMILNYFADNDRSGGRIKIGKDVLFAYYRLPIMSNKPSEEYLRFRKYVTGIYDEDKIYQEELIPLFARIAELEIKRISTCRDRANDSSIPKIKNFDSTPKKKGRGESFQFIEYLLDYLDLYTNWSKEHSNNNYADLFTKKTELQDKIDNYELTTTDTTELDNLRDELLKIDDIIFGKMLEDKISENPMQFVEDEYSQYMEKAIRKGMQKNFLEYLDTLRLEGILEQNSNGIFTLLAELKLGANEKEVMAALENFFWNDTFAAMNILQLTVTDVAYYKDTEDLLKRLALIHAPGLRGNTEATWNGIKVSDGKERTIYIADFEKVVSDAIESVRDIFSKKEAKLREVNPKEADEFHKVALSLIESFKDINVTDAQGYNSPTSYRKKAIIFGKWSDELEEAYKELRDGKLTTSNLEATTLPLKPFVYSNTTKESPNCLLDKLKVGMLNKNSEYLLTMLDAILLGESESNKKNGTPKMSKLAAIYLVMEESHYDNNGNYRTLGIDTVLFNSTVKAGEMGVIDINSASTTLEAADIIRAAIYKDINSRQYNPNTVHELEFEDYCLQSEVPAHLEGESIFGSLTRILGISDMPEVVNGKDSMIRFRGKYITMHQLKLDYQNAIAKNIQESLLLLVDEFHLTGTLAEKNIALSRMLLKQIKLDSRFGYDLLYAVCTDENGKFNIPLSDPVLAGRILLLLSSIIKSRINKLQIQGGPVVLVTNFGTSSELDMVFLDKDGNRLDTLREFFTKKMTERKKQRLLGKHSINSFGARFGHLFSKKNLQEETDIELTYSEFVALAKCEDKPNSKNYDLYLKYYKPIVEEYKEKVLSKQHSVMYWECYAPATAFKLFAREDGSIHIEDIPEEMLNIIGYRIPTEAKYSMAPLKIVGLLPIIAGEGIMLPKDITLLSGSDFDVDKLYIIRPEVDDIIDWKESYKLYLKETLTVYDAKEIWDDLYATWPEVVNGIQQVKNEYILEQKALGDNRSDEEILKDAHRPRELDWLTPEERLILWEKYFDEYDTSEYVLKEGSNQSWKDWKKEQLTLLKSKNSKDRNKSKLVHLWTKLQDNSTRKGRNNIIFDTLYSVLTSELAADLMFVPGNFDEPKKYGYMSEVMEIYNTKDKILEYIKDTKGQEIYDKNITKDWYEIIDSLSVDDLKDAILKRKNLAYNHIHLMFHKQNMVAGKLIGVFALNNVSHSVISLIDLQALRDDNNLVVLDNTGKPKLITPTILLSKEDDILIEGEHLYRESGTPFDTLLSKDGLRISKALAAFLAASVDAVKDPVLNYMNINQTTAGVLTTLVRLGYDTELSMLFLTQPIIKELIRRYTITNETNYVSMGDLIGMMISEIKEKNKDLSISDSEIPAISKNGLIASRQRQTPESLINLLKAYLVLSDISYTTSHIVQLTKFNSVTSAVGPLLTDTFLMRLLVREAMEDSRLLSTSMLMALSNPIIVSFRQASFAANDLLFKGTINNGVMVESPIMILASSEFEEILDLLLKRIKANISRSDMKDTINRLLEFYVSFLLTTGEHPIFLTDKVTNPLSYERRRSIIKDLPKRVKAALKTSINEFLHRIEIKPADENHSTKWLYINTRGMKGDVSDAVGMSWTDLLQEDPSLAMDLAEYNFNIGGLGFSPITFAKLLSVTMRNRIPNYTSILGNVHLLGPELIEIMFDLFFRNNHYDRKLVPNISKTRKGVVVINNGIATVRVNKDSRFKVDGNPISYFMLNDIMYKFITVKGNIATYKAVSKLGGLHNEVLEVSAKGIDKSIIDDKIYETGKNVEESKEKSDFSSYSRLNTSVLLLLTAFLLTLIPDNELELHLTTLNRARYVLGKEEEASKRAVAKLIKDYGFTPNLKAIDEISSMSRVIRKTINHIHTHDIAEERKILSDMEITMDKLNLCK